MHRVALLHDEEADERIRALLAGELAETTDCRLTAFFAVLDDANESVAHWAEVGLELIDTKDVRTALFPTRSKA